jgi:cytochrome c-type biogenesis protein CcmH/NrfG
VKKETLITIAVFLGVGFLGGYAYNAHRNSLMKQSTTPAAEQPANSQPDGPAKVPGFTAGIGLPQGHPPVDARQIMQFLEAEATQNPTDPGPRLKLANFLYDQQRWAEAVSSYRQALRLSPRNVDALTDMATCSFNLGQFTEAISELNAALRINPHHKPTLFNLIVVDMEGIHNLQAAERAWERLNAIDPGYPRLAELKQSLDAEMASARSPALN